MRDYITTDYFGGREPLDDRRDQLLSSLEVLTGDSAGRDIANSLGIDLAAAETWRVRELAVAINKIEAAMERQRPPLELKEPRDLDEIENYPGFDLMQHEVMDEEIALLSQLDRARKDVESHEPDSEGRPKWFWELAVAVNAAFKGLLGSQGESGHICARTEAIKVELPVDEGWETVKSQIAASLPPTIEDGDVIVVADKVVGTALGRFGPRAVILDPDPKTVSRELLPQLAEQWTTSLGFDVQPVHLLLADEYENDRSVLGADDHNGRAAEIATAILQLVGANVDVVISDTDTGIDTQTFLIGTLTIGATPLGATAGVTVYEAMRCAVAAEFTRGHTKRVPIVRCVPADRRRGRLKIGEARRYAGVIDAEREGGLGYG